MRKFAAFAIASLLASTAFAAGDIYRWKDSGGAWHYSDQPVPGAELVRSTRRPGATSSSPANAPLSSPTPPAVPAGNTLTVTPEVAQQVRAEAANSKAQRCEKAKVDYDQAIQSLRLYKLDDKGNRTYLTAAETDAARLEARSIRDLACSS